MAKSEFVSGVFLKSGCGCEKDSSFKFDTATEPCWGRLRRAKPNMDASLKRQIVVIPTQRA